MFSVLLMFLNRIQPTGNLFVCFCFSVVCFRFLVSFSVLIHECEAMNEQLLIQGEYLPNLVDIP